MAAQFLSSIAICVVILHGTSAFQVAHHGYGTTLRQATLLHAEPLSRREALVGAASVSAAMLVASPPSALADGRAAISGPVTVKPDKETAAKFYFNGVFKDMKHPEGYRVVTGAINKSGTVQLKDSPDGSVIEIPVMAKKDEKTGQLTLDLDFSEYYKFDGPKDIVATVNKKGDIKFPDGNVWKKEGGVVGVYIDGFAPYPKYRRVVLPGKEDNVSVMMVSGKTIFEAAGVDMGKRGLQVDFPGKQCAGKVNTKQGTIAWADGNVWTKV